MSKQAQMGFLGRERYDCKQPWPEDCFCQCGSWGLVMPIEYAEDVLTGDEPMKSLSKAAGDKRTRTTAFFEAFPDHNFIRGEGATIEEAEAAAWAKFCASGTKGGEAGTSAGPREETEPTGEPVVTRSEQSEEAPEKQCPHDQRPTLPGG